MTHQPADRDVMQGEALLPCPYCANPTSEDWGETTIGGFRRWRFCPECNATGPQILSRRGQNFDEVQARADEAWNDRALSTPPIAQSDREAIAHYWADWLVDAVATATQNRAFLRKEPEEDEVATEAIYLNGKKAIENAFAALRPTPAGRAAIVEAAREVTAPEIARVLCLVDGRDPDDEAPRTEMTDAANMAVPWLLVYMEYAEAVLEKFKVRALSGEG